MIIAELEGLAHITLPTWAASLGRRAPTRLRSPDMRLMLTVRHMPNPPLCRHPAVHPPLLLAAVRIANPMGGGLAARRDCQRGRHAEGRDCGSGRRRRAARAGEVVGVWLCGYAGWFLFPALSCPVGCPRYLVATTADRVGRFHLHCCQRPPIARQAYWLACSLAAGGLLKFRTVGRREYSHLLRLSEWRGRPGGQAEHRVHVPGCGMCRPPALRSDCCLSRLPHAATVHTSQAIPATPMCCRRCADQLHACARGAGRFHLREPAFLCGGELATAAATAAALCCVVLCTCACLELCPTLL